LAIAAKSVTVAHLTSAARLLFWLFSAHLQVAAAHLPVAAHLPLGAAFSAHLPVAAVHHPEAAVHLTVAAVHLIVAAAHLTSVHPTVALAHRMLGAHLTSAAATISAAIGLGEADITITTEDGGMRSPGGLEATAIMITGLPFALRGGDIRPNGTTAACALTASIEGGNQVKSVPHQSQ